jgi:hypothetical protein
MTDWINAAAAWITAATGQLTGHPAVTAVAAVTALLIVASLIVVQAVAARRGRGLTFRASVGFTVVQAGVAYVTITGVYQFWAHRVGMPWPEAALIAAFIEAVTWAAVSMIFVHGAKPGSTGTGEAGPLFWTAVVGGGMQAVIGAPTWPVALGRIVVVVIGANMWWLRIRLRTRPAVTRRRTRLTVTPAS